MCHMCHKLENTYTFNFGAIQKKESKRVMNGNKENWVFNFYSGTQSPEISIRNMFSSDK